MTDKANKHNKNHEQNSIMPVEVKKEPKTEDNEDLPLTVARSNRDEIHFTPRDKKCYFEIIQNKFFFISLIYQINNDFFFLKFLHF